jgi:hypothetical protein
VRQGGAGLPAQSAAGAGDLDGRPRGLAGAAESAYLFIDRNEYANPNRRQEPPMTYAKKPSPKNLPPEAFGI